MRTPARNCPHTVPYDPSFLAGIHVYSVLVFAEVERSLQLGAFSGASLRGAIGNRLHEVWCRERVKCSGDCKRPDACKYPLLFGAHPRDHARRPFAIRPLVRDEFVGIAHGLPVEPPFEVHYEGKDHLPRLGILQDPPARESAGETATSGTIPKDKTHAKTFPQPIPVGKTVTWGVTFFGEGTLVAQDAMNRIAENPLPWAGGCIRVLRFEDTLHPPNLPLVRSLAECLETAAQPSDSLQLIAETPIAIHTNQPVDPRGDQYVRHILTQCLVRAKRAYQQTIGARQEMPIMNLPELEFSVSAARLFRMEVMRTGKKGKTRLPMRGILGNWRLAGDFSRVLPLLKIGELLGIGQHTTAGFGQIRHRFEVRT